MVLTEHMVAGVKHISTQELLTQSTYKLPLFYIAAAINASQFVAGHRMRYVLRAGDVTTDNEGHIFHNRAVEIGFMYFFRVFSVNSTSEVLSVFSTVANKHVCMSLCRMKYQLRQIYRRLWVSACVVQKNKATTTSY